MLYLWSVLYQSMPHRLQRKRNVSYMKNRNSNTIPFPETYTRRQLNALYREIPLTDTASRTLRKYFHAMANLYGVITLQKAFEIISSQSPKLVTEAEFLRFAEIARHECEGYCILGDDEIHEHGKTESLFAREIIDNALIDEDMDAYMRTKESQQGKPFHIPEKKELLLYQDAHYFGETPESAAFLNFLHAHAGLTDERRLQMVYEIFSGSRYIKSEFSDVMDVLEKHGVTFATDAALREFLNLYGNFHNTTRMQCNRGHTPREISQLQPKSERVPRSISFGPNMRKMLADGTMDAAALSRDILTMDLPNEDLRISMFKELVELDKANARTGKTAKTGRNDPCPCGSGKKYKKCCGR